MSKHFINIAIYFNPYNNLSVGTIIIPISQIQMMRPGDIKLLAKDLTAV